MPGKLTITFDTKPISLLLLNSKVSAINKLGKYLGKDRFCFLEMEWNWVVVRLKNSSNLLNGK